jgi:hypothetical protein
MDIIEYIKLIEGKSYVRERLHIDETSEIVTLYNPEKERFGKVISIRCPSRYKIFIFGRNQSPKNVLSDSIDLHKLALRLTDSNGKEISPDSRIRIIKEKPSLETMLCATMLYKDVTRTEYSKISPDRTKPNEKLYIFDNSIQMNGEDRLCIEIIQPNLDINNSGTRLDLDIDLLEEL